MRPTRLIAAAAGPTAWIPLDYVHPTFGIGYYCSVQQSASLTYKIQHGWLDLARDSQGNGEVQDPRITRSTTTATLTFRTAMSPKVGDSMRITGSDVAADTMYGTYDVATVTNSTTVTYTVVNTGVTANVPGTRVQYIRVQDDPVNTGLTASAEGNLAFPCYAMRLYVTGYVSGAVALIVNQGGY